MIWWWSSEDRADVTVLSLVHVKQPQKFRVPRIERPLSRGLIFFICDSTEKFRFICLYHDSCKRIGFMITRIWREFNLQSLNTWIEWINFFLITWYLFVIFLSVGVYNTDSDSSDGFTCVYFIVWMQFVVFFRIARKAINLAGRNNYVNVGNKSWGYPWLE